MPATVRAKVPLVVIGEPATEMMPPVNDWATLVTVPVPAADQVPSPRQKVDADADVPLFKLVTGRLPVTPVVKGSPVALVNVPLEGVPNAPPFTTGEPAEPTLIANAVATPVPKPVIEPTAGVTVVFVALVIWPCALTAITGVAVAEP